MARPKTRIATVRSAEGLRDSLFQELDLFRAGTVSVKEANTTVNIARAIIDSARLELLGVAIGQHAKQLQNKGVQGLQKGNA